MLPLNSLPRYLVSIVRRNSNGFPSEAIHSPDARFGMSRRSHLARLRQQSPLILPSVLSCDFSDMRGEVERLETAGVQALHLDVMDGNFVPNITYGMPIVAAFRKLTQLPLDVHLMIENPERYIRQFYEAGADIITVHEEATGIDTANVLQEIKNLGCGAGVTINPDIPVERVLPFVDTADLILVMSVNAGFGGQTFNPVALEKLEALRKVGPPELLLEVDGGVNLETVQACTEAGADLLVIGSAIFNQSDYGAAIDQLYRSAQVST
ncbi:Ribulose-phosphate 3-epimerase [Bremerella volcania]|uniref:Ribulose-phosphate 3-epimerase n=2 Tax=Bremerella volcania TaxID=2527984 RepID=A0A518CEX1_9BACT|nr:Ribulose-phosphate 3-epimerase [Bremerella volcania]